MSHKPREWNDDRGVRYWITPDGEKALMQCQTSASGKKIWFAELNSKYPASVLGECKKLSDD